MFNDVIYIFTDVEYMFNVGVLKLCALQGGFASVAVMFHAPA